MLKACLKIEAASNFLVLGPRGDLFICNVCFIRLAIHPGTINVWNPHLVGLASSHRDEGGLFGI